jgi:agmatine deiminase
MSAKNMPRLVLDALPSARHRFFKDRNCIKQYSFKLVKKLIKLHTLCIRSNNMTHYQPAEWERHRAVWSAWPSHADLWQENLAPARAQVAAFFQAIDDGGRGEALEILVHGEEALASAQAALGGLNVTFHAVPFGDIWLRDTAPIFVRTGSIDQPLAATCFAFNGWGGKYILPHDAQVSQAVAELSGLPIRKHALVLEGGSVDVDGAGLGLTTRECLLNPNRNPNLTPAEIEAQVMQALGLKRLIWLEGGLLNDHTDGHIDNLARFVAPGHVVVPKASGGDDPNRAVYEAAEAACREAGLRVSLIPSPGLIANEEGDVVPASSMNFYISNTAVVVPLYQSPWDASIVASLAPLFPTRRVVGLPARAVLTGGGSFHCITQQVPAV